MFRRQHRAAVRGGSGPQVHYKPQPPCSFPSPPGRPDRRGPPQRPAGRAPAAQYVSHRRLSRRDSIDPLFVEALGHRSVLATLRALSHGRKGDEAAEGLRKGQHAESPPHTTVHQMHAIGMSLCARAGAASTAETPWPIRDEDEECTSTADLHCVGRAGASTSLFDTSEMWQ